MNSEELKTLISSGLSDADITIKGEGDHFEAVVVSTLFDGKSMLEQHRMVYATLGERMGNEIHALALQTFTPEDWAKRPRIQ